MYRIFTLALVCLLLNSRLYAAINDPVTEKNAELEQITLKISQLEKTLGYSRNKQKKLNQELANTEITLGQLSKELASNADELAQNQKVLEQIKQEISDQQQNVQQQQQLLAQQLKVSYQLGQDPPLKIVLNQNDPNKIVRLLNYYAYLNKARDKAIHSMQFSMKQMVVNKEQLAENGQNLTALIAQTQKKQQVLESNQQYRQKLISQLSQDIDNSKGELTILQANKQQLEKLIKRLNKRSTRRDQAFKTKKKQLPWPITGEIIEYNDSNQVVKYPGLLLKAASGSPIYAIYDGQVKFASWLRGYGLLIIIDHGDGYMSLYGHNQSLYAEIGDQVQQGDLIARVGNSGGNQQEGLYFEIRHDGKIINPAKFLQ